MPLRNLPHALSYGNDAKLYAETMVYTIKAALKK